jgi:hypothetical protein
VVTSISPTVYTTGVVENPSHVGILLKNVAKVDFLLVGRVATSVTNSVKSSEVGVDTLPKFAIDLSAIWFPYE